MMCEKNKARIEELEKEIQVERTIKDKESIDRMNYLRGIQTGIKEGAQNEREGFLAWLEVIKSIGLSLPLQIAVDQKRKELEGRT